MHATPAQGLFESPSDRLLDLVPDAMIVVGPDGKIALANVQVEKLFGYTRGELLGAALELLVPEASRAAHARHVQRFQSSPAGRPMGSGLELFGRHKDGTTIPIEVSLGVVHSAEGVTVSAAIRDISDRKKLEAAALLSAQRFASAVESIDDGFALFDADDRLVLCNSVYRALYREGDGAPIVGRTRTDLTLAFVPEIDFANEEAAREFVAARARDDRHSTTYVLRTRDGRVLRMMDRATAEGGIVKTVTDLTKDEQLKTDVSEARAAAEAASAAKSEFLASMSHELRTPLNAVLGFAQLLHRDRKQPLSERQRERVDQIMRGGEHLLHLIDDILDLSRIETGHVAVSLEPVEVAEVVEDVRATLLPIAVRQGVTIEETPRIHELSHVLADRTRFRQILMNFGSNAIKYNRPGGTMRLSVERVGHNRERVVVRDTGIGVPIDKQQTLFQPFQRAGQETGPIEGTGIGLVISKRLADLMNGSVGFESRPGEGSTFWVELPIDASPAMKLPPRGEIDASAVLLPVRHAGGRQLAIYVEDNPANVRFMKEFVADIDGLDLVTLPTAELGIELAHVYFPAVILMDLNLPGMSGFDALDVLKGDPATEKIPVIALTAAASERDRQRGLRAGFHRYLTKPVNVAELTAALEEVLRSAP